MSKRLLLIIVALAALILSLFASPALPQRFSYNLFALVVVVFLLAAETRTAYAAALVGGFVSDLVSALPFGTALVAFPLGLAVTRWLFRTRFTNRSLLAYLGLATSGTLLIELFLLAISTIGRLVDPPALAIVLNHQWLAIVAIALARNFILSGLVYAALRLNGQSYASLVQREF